jgi:hypothetical protein
MLVTTTSYNEYLGRMAVGRVARGSIKLNDPIALMKLDGRKVVSNATKLFMYQGLKQVECPEAKAGDIIHWPASRMSNRRDRGRGVRARGSTAHHHRRAHHEHGVLGQQQPLLRKRASTSPAAICATA